MTLFEIILKETKKDFNNMNNIGADLMAYYSELNEKEKIIMDNCFTKLTGYNFSILVKMCFAQHEKVIK